MRDRALALLAELTEAHAISGSEDTVRAIFRRELADFGEISCDRLGSILCRRSGPAGTPRVLAAGHMDEVGFVVQSITAKGQLKLVPIGGWWMHVIVAQRLRILTRSGREILGVVGSTPPHFLGEGAKDKLMTMEQISVDVGAGSAAEVAALGIRIGDPVAPDSRFTPMAQEGRYMAKAFDNRSGMAVAIQAMQECVSETLPCTFLAAGSVQEEVGCRGAQTLGALAQPDVAIVLECTPADDTGSEPDPQGALGKGVQIRVLDPTALMNRRLVDLCLDTAAAEGIPHQLSVRRGGGTDAKSLQFIREGVPCVVLGTPARYIHSHNAIMDIHDHLSTLRLVLALLKRLDRTTVDALTAW